MSPKGRFPLLATIASGAGWTYVQVAASVAWGLFMPVFVVRRGGADAFGQIAIIAVVAGLAVLIDTSLGTIVVRWSAQAGGEDERATEAQASVQVAHDFYAVASGALFLLIALGSIVVVDDPDVLLTTILVACGFSLSTGSAALVGIATGSQRFRLVSCSAVVGVVTQAACLALLFDTFGVVAVGLAAVAGALVGRALLIAGIRTSVPWLRLQPASPIGERLRELLRQAAPMVVMAVSGYVVAICDVVVIGFVATTAAVGDYRLGAVLPAQIVGVLYRGSDVTFPILARSTAADQIALTRITSRATALVAGAVLGAMFVARNDVVHLLVGGGHALAASVLGIFALVWFCNAPAHGVALFLVARGRQALLSRLIAVEAVANLALTIGGAIVFGPLGAAVATLVTLGISNLVVLPLLVRGRVEPAVWKIPLVAARDGVTSLVASAAAVALLGSIDLDPVFAVAAALGTAAVIAAALTLTILGKSDLTVLRSGSNPVTSVVGIKVGIEGGP